MHIIPLDPFIIDNIIALCHIIDEFEEFKERLLPYLQNEFNRDFVSQLRCSSQGSFKIFASKERKFYKENKLVVDIVNEHSSISRFISAIWDSKGQQNPDFQRIYEYILKYKDQRDTIIDVLKRVKKLGFYRFDFDDSIDFTKETYKVYPALGTNRSITFVPNIQINNDLEDYTSYKTTDSNYKIELAVEGDDIVVYESKIILNSLVFDADSLPTSLTRENTFEYIMLLKYGFLCQSIRDLQNQLNTLKSGTNNNQLIHSDNESYARKLNLKKE